MISYFTKFLNRLNWNNISIKNRVLAVFSFCLILSSIISIIINSYLHLPFQANIIVTIIMIVHSLAFYYSIKNLISDRERCLYLSIMVTLLPIAWIYNGGLVGSIPMYFFMYFTASILSLTASYRNYFIIYIFVLTLIALAIQNYFPEIIIPYTSAKVQLFDLKFAFIQVVFITVVITITFTSINDETQLKMTKQKEELQESLNQLAIAKELAEKATIAKTNFITNISHEIRTPLNGIVGISNLLNTNALNEEQKVLIQSLDLSSKTLLDLINDLLDLSKMESNKLTLNNEPFDIRNTINEANELTDPLIKDKDIILQTIIQSNTPTYVLLDRTKFKQVLINLLSNAIKFTDQGKVTCTISYDPVVSTLTARIEDTGIGIAKEDIEKLFTPFTQLNKPNSIANNGIGMGLAISKKMIDLMQGEIHIKSTIDIGSCFTVTIPCTPISQELIKTKEMTETSDNNNTSEIKECHILIAEDHKINQIVIAKMLEKLNHTYEFANNGQEAIDLCLHKTFDIILMDIQMPLVNGIEAAKIIIDRYNELGNPLPKIIICSANTMQIDKKEELKNYINGYLTKPINLTQLADIINNS